MSAELNLYVDIVGGKLVQSLTSTKAANLKSFVFGDVVPVKVWILEASSSADRVWDATELANKTVRLGIGAPGSQPSAGTFDITYDGDTFSGASYSISAADLQTGLNALASVTAAGGVTVTKSTGGVYRISFNDPGVVSDFSVDGAALYPTTSPTVVTAVEGTVSVRETVLIRFETQPAAYVELTDAITVVPTVVETIQSGGGTTPEIQKYTLDESVYGGSYTITIGAETTAAIPYDASLTEIKLAIAALSGVTGNSLLQVTGGFPEYTVSFSYTDGNLAEMTVDDSNLITPWGLYGDLNLNTSGFIELLDGESTTDAKLEVEIFDTVDSTSYTPVQVPCILKEDVTGNSPASTTPLPTYLTTSTSGVAIATILGLTSYADLTAANAAEVPGIPYWDIALGRINVTTA